MFSKSNSSAQRTFAIIGGGLAAQNTLFYLLELLGQSPPPYSWKIIQFHSPHLAPACSFNSTSLCAMRGAKRETLRGDLLINGFEEALHFVKTHQPRGVEWGQLFSLCPCNHPHEEDFKRRFGEKVQRIQGSSHLPTSLGAEVWSHAEEAMFFNPSSFFEWQEQKVAERIRQWNGSLSWEKVPAFIQEFTPLEEKKLFQLTDEYGKKHQVHGVVFCTGAYTQIFSSLLTSPSSPTSSPPAIIKNSQVQAGNMLEFSSVDWGESSWAINLLEKKIMVYKASEKILLLSGVQAAGPQSAPVVKNLMELYHEFKSLLGIDHQTKFSWPDWREGKVKVGFRQKGVKRRPFWGQIRSWPNGTKVYGLFSLYKNGLSYSFWGAKQLAHLIADDFYSNS